MFVLIYRTNYSRSNLHIIVIGFSINTIIRVIFDSKAIQLVETGRENL